MNTFTLFPAIDLKEGQCVRLLQGRAEDVTVYAKDPVEMARHWEAQGAKWLHVVDLDGAFDGAPRHTRLIADMAEAVEIPLQVGGGMRTDDDIRRTLDAGARRVILGTRILSEPEGLRDLAELFGERLVVGIDARDGQVQVKGWTETTETKATTLANDVARHGVETIIYTDTATDGMLQGVNITAVEEVCDAASCSVIASGGVSTLEDVKALKALGQSNLVGAIVGKALYEKRVSLPELQDV